MAGDSRKTEQNINSSDADVEAAGRTVGDHTAAVGAKPSAARVTARKEAASALTERTRPAADRKTEDEQAETTASLSKPPPSDASVSTPAPRAIKKPLEPKERRDVHPFALWVPLIAVGVFGWFMHNRVQGPSSQETAVIATETSAGATENVLAPPVGAGTAPKAVSGVALPDSAPPQERAGERAQSLGGAERSAAGMDKRGPPQPREAHVAIPAGQPAAVLPQSTAEVPPPRATSVSEPAARGAKDQVITEAPSDRRDAATQPTTQYSPPPATSPELPAQRAQAIPLPTEAAAPRAAEAVSSADPGVLSTPPTGQDEQGSQAPAASSGSSVSEPQPPHSTAPGATVPAGPNIPKWLGWPRAAPPNIYPYAGPYGYPQAFGGHSFGRQAPMDFRPFGGPPYSGYGWPGR